jgi:hypothetical protein
MPEMDDQVYKRAAKQQFYEDFRKYAKAPPFRRSVAALIDFSLLGIPAVYGFLWTHSYFIGSPFVLYLLVRDRVLLGRSLGKAATGLVVVHKETFAPCTLQQSLICNSLYATVCPALLLIGVAAMGIGAMFLSLVLVILAFTNSGFSPLFFIGYDPNDGRTIPDSWAETHVLTPKEIATIIKLRDELATTVA